MERGETYETDVNFERRERCIRCWWWKRAVLVAIVPVVVPVPVPTVVVAMVVVVEKAV